MPDETAVELAQRLVDTEMRWDSTYATQVPEGRLTLRLNDFPAEPLCTLLLDDGELADVEDLALPVEPDVGARVRGPTGHSLRPCLVFT